MYLSRSLEGAERPANYAQVPSGNSIIRTETNLSRSLDGAERPADYAQVPNDAILSNDNNHGVIRELCSLHIRAYMQKNSIVIITPGLRITTFIYYNL